MKQTLADRWYRLRYDPNLGMWLRPGLYGGLSGGAAVAWSLWGWPDLLQRGVCFVFWVPLAIVAFLFVCAMGVSLVLFVQRLIKAIRRLTMSPAVAMWEPMDPMVELDLFAWPHPGCGLALYVPLILLSAICSVTPIVLAFLQAPIWRVLLLMFFGVPFGIWMARSESKSWRKSDEGVGRGM